MPGIFLSFTWSVAFAELSLTEKQKELIRPEPATEKTINESESTKVVATPENHIFKVAKDRPIEKIGHAEGPIEMDSYIYLKFEKLEKHLQKALDRIEARLERLEETVKLDPAVRRAITAEEKKKQKETEAEKQAERPQVLRAG